MNTDQGRFLSKQLLFRLNNPRCTPSPISSAVVAESEPDLFESTEAEIDVDAETAAAIVRGIRAAEEGRTRNTEGFRGYWHANYQSRTRMAVNT